MIADTLVLFPYKNGKVIDSSIMASEYPNAFDYLNSKKDKLLPKERGGTRDVPDPTEWYQFGRTQFLKESTQDKIIVGVMSKQPNFNIDRTNMLFSSGSTAGDIAILMKKGSEYKLEYIQAWLSHPFTDNIFKVVGSSFEGGFYTHGTDMYDAIPLLPIDFLNKKEMGLYNNIIFNVKRIENLNKELESLVSEKKKKFIGAQINVLITKINHYIDILIQWKVVD